MTLAFLFNITIRNAMSAKPLEKIPVAVVNVDDEALNSFLTSMENDHGLFAVQEFNSKDKALVELENNKVAALVEYDEIAKLTVLNNEDSNTTIIANVFSTYNMKQTLIADQMKQDASKVTPLFLDELINPRLFVISNTDKKMNEIFVINIFTTISMLCVYASQWGVRSGYYMQADKNKLAIRTNSSPIKKSTLVLLDVGVVYFIFLIEFALHLAFLKYGLNISLGTQPLILVLTGLIGGLLSASFGYMICVSINKSEGILSFLVSGLGVLLSFLSGMMSVDVKYAIDTNFPIINKLNPAALITDNFYNSFAGKDLMASYTNLGIMLVMTLIFGYIAFRKLRTATYDSV